MTSWSALWVSLSLSPLPFTFRPREGSKENSGGRSKRALEEEEANTDGLSKNKQKKQLRNPHKTFDSSLKRKCCSCPWAGEELTGPPRRHLYGPCLPLCWEQKLTQTLTTTLKDQSQKYTWGYPSQGTSGLSTSTLCRASEPSLAAVPWRQGLSDKLSGGSGPCRSKARLSPALRWGSLREHTGVSVAQPLGRGSIWEGGQTRRNEGAPHCSADRTCFSAWPQSSGCMIF